MARCKKERPNTKMALVKGVKPKRLEPPAFDRFKVLIMMTSLQNTVILGAQGLLMWDQNF